MQKNTQVNSIVLLQGIYYTDCSCSLQLHVAYKYISFCGHMIYLSRLCPALAVEGIVL